MKALPPVLRTVSPAELAERIEAERRRTLLVYAAAAVPDAAPTDTARDSIPPELSPAQRRVLAALCRPAHEQPFAGP